MTRVLISNRLARDFSMVPDALWRSALPFAAKGVAAYLLSLRHGAMPYVAEMENAMGLGRDARRKAFAQLEAVGFIAWQIERDGRRIVGKTLLLDPLAFDEQEARAISAPEIQADSAAPVSAPEIPADGNATPRGTANRRYRDGKSGDTYKQNDKRGATAPTASRLPQPDGGGGSPFDLSETSPFQRKLMREGKTVALPCGVVSAGTAQHAQLQAALAVMERGEVAENGCKL